MQTKTSFLLCSIILLIKFFSIHYTNFDFFGDEAQYWVWSQNLDLGYYSKPPLLSWLIATITTIFGDSFETLKAIPITIYIFTSYLIFLVYKQLYHNTNEAILAGLTFYLLPAVTVSSFLISTDILLIFFWSLSALFLLKIRERTTKINFIFLGVFLGLSFLSKYAAIYFFLSIMLVLFFDTKLRNIFFDNVAYVALSFFIIILILSPNIIWNINNSWITLNHTMDNASLNRVNISFLRGLEFIGAQIIMLGPILFFFFLFTIKKINASFETRFLLTFSIPVFIIVLIESILVRANANWAAVALVPFYIFCFHFVYQMSKKIIMANIFFNFLFGICFFYLIATSSSLSPFNRINGVSFFAKNLNEHYLEKTNILVVTDRLLYSNLKYLLKSSKINMFTPHTPNTKIKNHFQITTPLLSSTKKNFLFLGSPNQIEYLDNQFSIKKLKSLKTKFNKEPIEIYEVFF